jgi:hypothetical protein
MRAFVERMREPSSWAGMGILWTLLGPKLLPWDLVVNAGAGICALLAVLLRERGE